MSDEKNDEADGFAAAYRQHANTLRSWLVAYGAGGPALFLTNDKLRESLRTSDTLTAIAIAFLLGIGLQVFHAFIDKYANWICYYRAANPGKQANCWSKCAERWVESNALSVLFEVASITSLAVATFLAFRVALVAG